MKNLALGTEKTSVHLLQGDDDFLAHEKANQTNFGIFSDLCDNLLNYVAHKKIIPERNLWDFNKIIIGLIRDTAKQLPNSYIELDDQLSDYWRYELESETNSERKYSYIRLYQASRVLKAYYEDQKEEEEIVSFLNKYEAAYKLLDKIQHKPGITFKMLQDSLHISAGNLSSASFKDESNEMKRQLDSLEKDGFLLKRGLEEYPYFILTNTGDILCKKLYNQKKGNIWSYRWTYERVAVFFYMIVQSVDKHGINGNLIRKVLQMILEYDDAQIIQYMYKKTIATEYQNVLEKNGTPVLSNINNKWSTISESYFRPLLFVDEISTRKKEYYKKTLKCTPFYHMNAENFNKRVGIWELEQAELVSVQNR